MEVTGNIKRVAREGKSLQLDNEIWYSHFSDAVPFKEGDTVKITYNDNTKDGKTYHNWSKVELITSSPVKEQPQKNRDTSFYISYAKDLLVAGWTVEDAIKAINELKEAF